MAYHRVHGVDVKIARIFNTYGPRLRPRDGRVVSNLLAQALRGQPLTVYGDGTQTRSFCYVDNQVRGLLALSAAEPPGPSTSSTRPKSPSSTWSVRCWPLPGPPRPSCSSRCRRMTRPGAGPTSRWPGGCWAGGRGQPDRRTALDGRLARRAIRPPEAGR